MISFTFLKTTLAATQRMVSFSRETSQEAVAVLQVCDDGHRARLGSVGLQRKTETKPVVTDPPD